MKRGQYKKNKSTNQEIDRGDIIKSISQLSLDEINSLNQSLPVLLQSKIETNLNSDNIEEIMKANLLVGEKMSKSDQKIKSVFFDPNDYSSSGRGFKSAQRGASFATLQRMGDIFIIKAIVNTRIEQVQNFLKFSIDEQKEGYTIKKKKSLFDEASKEPTTEEKKKIEHIVNFLEQGGENDKWENIDSFQDFIRKIIRDSLTLDQLAFEIVRSKGGEMKKFRAVDASMIRLLDSADPRLGASFEQYRYRGYLPRYAMVYDGQILKNPTTDELIMYYPWELGYGVRNKSTNIYRNGYGTSELEILMEIMTWILWGMQYNGNFFKQGSQPKGFINIKGSNIDNSTLNEFRQAWSQTMRGVANSHKTPILQGVDLEWIDLQHTNRDMEFDNWVKFLMIISCAVYRIDPSELGFNFGDQSSPFGQDGQKERLSHSKEKGLKPLLTFIQNVINKYIASEIDEDYEFSFTGIEVEDESAQVDLDAKKISNGFISMEDAFRKYSGRDFDPEKDTILNAQYQAAAQAKMFGGQSSNDMVDQQTGEPGSNVQSEQGEQVPNEESAPPEQSGYEEYTKSYGENPIMKSAFDYINKMFEK